MDLTTLTDEELNALGVAVGQERERRWTLISVPDQMATLNVQYLTASGEAQGEQWRQPTGAHDAYPINWTVYHPDPEDVWVSLVDANVWEPGVSGWRKQSGDDEWPDWVQPTGSHDAYPLGAKVSHNDKHWISSVGANGWEPGVYGWDEQ